MTVRERTSILLRLRVPSGIATIASLVLLQGCLRIGGPRDAPQASSRVQGVGAMVPGARPGSIGASEGERAVLASGISAQEQVASVDTRGSGAGGADNLRGPRRDRN